MKIISISGLDGSGKSTQIELLKNYFESQGKRVFYFHAVQFGIANKIKYGSSSGERKSITKSNFLGIVFRKIFLKIDIYRFKDLAKKLEREGYDYIISDRYFYDNAVNIEYLSSKAFPIFNIVKPDIAMYLQTDMEIIMQRERKPDQGIEYLKKKKEIFDKYAKEWNLKIIDGNRNKDIIFEEIKNYV